MSVLGVAVFGTVYLDLTTHGGTPQHAFDAANTALAALSLAASAMVALAGKAG